MIDYELFLYTSTRLNSGQRTSLWLLSIGTTIIVMIVWFQKTLLKLPKLKFMRWETDKKWLIWMMQWLHKHWIPNRNWWESRSNWNENQNASMIFILQCYSHKVVAFATFTSKVCRLIRYEEKWEKIEKISYSQFQEIKENSHIDLAKKIIETDFKK